ncbi:N-alpha-acetyltransferase 60 isoform X2 [Rhynchophorus ferrugineus]|uniref:N-alpha-acetyltransferase 60 isoform X2 n=1 Tax=Rhynchophorus ferrugineus TaxID=354439 RepID=UPI003FCEDEB2
MANINWYQHGNNINGYSAMEEKGIILCSLADVQLRFLCPEDLDEVRALCQDWFPIEYPFYWYEEITSSNSRFYSLAAVYKHQIIGLIVAEIKPHSCLNEEDAGILAKNFRDCDIAYILSLGVLKEYRRNGIATLLLDSLLKNLTTPERGKVKAVFLHVLTTNSAAIMFYEKRKIIADSDFTHFYRIIIQLKGNAKMDLCMSFILMKVIHPGQYMITSNLCAGELSKVQGFFPGSCSMLTKL